MDIEEIKNLTTNTHWKLAEDAIWKLEETIEDPECSASTAVIGRGMLAISRVLWAIYWKMPG